MNETRTLTPDKQSKMRNIEKQQRVFVKVEPNRMLLQSSALRIVTHHQQNDSWWKDKPVKVFILNGIFDFLFSYCNI